MSEIHDHTVASAACSKCGQLQDGAASMTQPAPPKPGDLSICLRCGHLRQFSAGGARIEISDDEFYALPADVQMEIYRMQRGLRALWKDEPTR